MAHTMAVKGIFEIVILKHPKVGDAKAYTLDAYTVHMKCYFEVSFKYQMYYYKNQQSGEVADIWKKNNKVVISVKLLN